jgi:hypothetical protein
MQKWETGTLGLLAITVAVVASSQTLSAPLTELFDSLFIQILAVFACVGAVYVSPVVGVALAVALALLFILRNNSHVQAKVLSRETGAAANYSPPTTNVEGEIVQVEIRDMTREEPKDVTKADVPADGSYPLDAVRPMQQPQLRPFEYAPQDDTGKNEFEMVGQSIDEKGMLPPSIKPWLSGERPTQQVLQL